jgi:peptidyl-prolyl cis-trans isomerase SurA
MKHLFLSLIFLSFISNYSIAQEDELIDGIIGVVGSKVILYSEIEGQLVQAKQSSMDVNEETQCLILQDLLFQSLLVNQAELDSVTVSEEQVNSELDQRIHYFEQQIGGKEKLEEFYGKSIAEIKDEFYTLIENRMMADQMKATITSGISITPKEIKKYYNDLEEDSIPLVGSKVEVAQITKQPEVSSEVKKETKEKLNNWRKEILTGDRTFAGTAVLYSNDPGTRGDGGEFGFVSRGTFVPEFDRIAFNMKEGEISEVFETDYGFHILELFERRGEQYSGRHILLIPKISTEDLNKSKEFLDSIYSLIEEGKYTFEAAAELFSDDKESKFSGGLIYNQNTATSKFEMNELDKQLFVVIDKMDVGDISKPAFMQSRDNKEAYRLVMLKSISDPHKANLKSDYQLIQNMATSEIRNAKVKDWIKDKTANTYIKVSDEYKDCSSISEWIK